MSNQARLTINGALMADPELFSEASFPSRLDRETLIDSIILEAGELGLYYTDPAYMRLAIKSWSRRRLNIWDEMIDTTELEYNPIWNKDGTIRETRTETRDHTGNEDTTGTVTDDGSTTLNYGQTLHGEVTDIESVNAYNGGAWQDAHKTETESDSNTGGSDTTKTDNTEKSVGNRKEKDNDVIKYDYERVEQGNIGVTSTQQLIKEQREVIDFDVYKIIADEFKAFFCILVY